MLAPPQPWGLNAMIGSHSLQKTDAALDSNLAHIIYRKDQRFRLQQDAEEEAVAGLTACGAARALVTGVSMEGPPGRVGSPSIK